MNDKERRERKPLHRRKSTWLVVGVVILIILLFFWVDIADIMGAGDGGTGVNEMPVGTELPADNI